MCSNICLTILGYFPGHIHAFYLIYKKMQAEERYGAAGYTYLGNGNYGEHGRGVPVGGRESFLLCSLGCSADPLGEKLNRITVRRLRLRDFAFSSVFLSQILRIFGVRYIHADTCSLGLVHASRSTIVPDESSGKACSDGVMQRFTRASGDTIEAAQSGSVVLPSFLLEPVCAQKWPSMPRSTSSCIGTIIFPAIVYTTTPRVR